MANQRDIRFITSADGVQIATAKYGSGPLLLKAATWLTHIEHAPAGTMHASLIDEFSRANTYVEYDTRGCGLSQRHVQDISFDAWIRDLEAVADSYGEKQFVLLGLTCAAGVAVEYAARHPERVSHLILFGGYATSYHSTSHPDPAVRREGDLMLELAAVGWGSPTPAFRQVFAARLQPDATPAQWAAFDKLQRDTASADVAVRHMRAMYAMNVKACASRVRCPTLVLHPRDDEMVRFEQGRRLAALIPGARFVPVPGRNHLPFPDEPAWIEFLQQTRQFLGQAPAPQAMPRLTGLRLTPRQTEVLSRVVHGQTDKQIAKDLSLSPRTVQMHVAGALKTLGCKNRTEAAHRATSGRLLAA